MTPSGEASSSPATSPATSRRRTTVTYTWCHGAAGTSLLFLALDRAGVETVAGEAPLAWHRRCLHSVRTSGLPARLHPGFWDNDGRCCGTAGVGDVFLDSWQRSGDDATSSSRCTWPTPWSSAPCCDGPHAYWRFLEHRAAEPLLPPGVGWMQGAAGIAAFLFRVGRVVRGRVAGRAVRPDGHLVGAARLSRAGVTPGFGGSPPGSVRRVVESRS